MNSNLVNYTKISPNSTNPREDTIKKITIHHMAGNLTVEQCGAVFLPLSRAASSNYGIGSDGRVGMYVEEKNRAWTSSSSTNDNQAITIEVANDVIGGDWHVSDTALNKLIELCFDICKRNGIKELNYTGDVRGNLTMHKFFHATSCPGPYLESKFVYIADEVNKKLIAPVVPKPVVKPVVIPSRAPVTPVFNGNVLRRGSQGSWVKAVQLRLDALGFDCKADSNFGKLTRAAVIAFQKSRKITTDGAVGKITWSKLFS